MYSVNDHEKNIGNDVCFVVGMGKINDSSVIFLNCLCTDTTKKCQNDTFT